MAIRPGSSASATSRTRRQCSGEKSVFRQACAPPSQVVTTLPGKALTTASAHFSPSTTMTCVRVCPEQLRQPIQRPIPGHSLERPVCAVPRHGPNDLAGLGAVAGPGHLPSGHKEGTLAFGVAIVPDLRRLAIARQRRPVRFGRVRGYWNGAGRFLSLASVQTGVRHGRRPLFRVCQRIEHALARAAHINPSITARARAASAWVLPDR